MTDDLCRAGGRAGRGHRARGHVDQDRLRGRRRRERCRGGPLRRGEREVGVPLVGEVYPAGHEDVAPEERHEQISIGCRIVAELGVDLIKTFHTRRTFRRGRAVHPGADPRPGVQEGGPRGRGARAGRDRDPRRRTRGRVRTQRGLRPGARTVPRGVAGGRERDGAEPRRGSGEDTAWTDRRGRSTT